MADSKLAYFKKKVLSHLDDLEQKENAEKKELKKSLIAFEMTSIEKSGYPVGTIREWKGKKYIKIAPGKWKPKYDSHSRGAKMAIAALKKKIDACTDSEELMQIILENRDRFSDENGRPLPFVKELSDYISGRNDTIESGSKETQKKAKAEADEKQKNKGREKPKEDTDFTLDDIRHIGDGKETKKVNDMETAKNVFRQIAEKYGTDDKAAKMAEDFMSLNIGGTNPLFDKILEEFNIDYNDLDDDFEACYRSMLKQSLGKSDKKEREDMKQGREEFADKYRQMIENEDKGFAEEPKPIGKGDFGEIYDCFKHKSKEAITFLLKKKSGEAIGALKHKDIGDIDLVYGEEGTSHSDGYGLAKLAKYHPEVLDNLQEVIDDMEVTSKSKNRVQLESKSHKASVRLTWNGKLKNWLLTAFEKNSGVSDSSTDIARTDGSRKNDTAPLANTASSNIPQNGKKSSGLPEDSNLLKAAEAYASDKQIAAYQKKVDINNFTMDDPTRYFMCGVYHEDGKQIATNGRYLLVEDADYPKELEGKIIAGEKQKKLLDREYERKEKEGEKPERYCNEKGEIRGQFPNYKRVIPDEEDCEDRTDEFTESLKQIEKNAFIAKKMHEKLKDNFASGAVKIGNRFFNGEYLSNILAVAKKHGGINRVYEKDRGNACVFVIEGKGYKAVIMSMTDDSQFSYIDSGSGRFVGEQNDRVKDFLAGNIKKSFDLFGYEIKDDDSDEEDEDEKELSAIKKAVAEALAMIA